MRDVLKIIATIVVPLFSCVVTYFIKPLWIWLNPDNKLPCFILFLVFFSLGLGVSFIWKNDRKRSLDLSKRLNTRTDNKRYSVIVVDDMFDTPGILDKYKNGLSNYDVFFLSHVEDIRFLYGFDIVVLDILGTWTSLEISPLIREMYTTIPYKYLIAMSSSSKSLQYNKAYLFDSILKPNKDHDALMDLIRERLDNAFAILDNPDRWWSCVEKHIISEQDSKKEQIKERFYSHLGERSLW